MIKLATLGIPALLAIIMHTPQSASGNWIGGCNCFGEPGCVSGWNHAIIQSQTDWNSGQYAKIQNGGNPDCFVGHAETYCNGYTEGYTYEWNTLYQWQQSQTTIAPTIGSQQKQFCSFSGNTTGTFQCKQAEQTDKLVDFPNSSL